MLTKEQVMQVLKQVQDPEIHKSIVDLNMVRNSKIDDTAIQLEVVLSI